jgi:spore coat polysaccharide biosynthesis protein SpsF (cytidylyltransferase family)
MKQKFFIEPGQDKDELVVKEYAEVEKDEYKLLCTETFDAKALRNALKEGEDELVKSFRTRNFFPPAGIAAMLAKKVTEFLSSKSPERIELAFDDKEVFQKKDGVKALLEDLDDAAEDEDTDELDDLLDDEDDIPKIGTSLKVAEDEGPADEDDS